MSHPTHKPLIGSPEPIAALNRVRITELSQPWQHREPLVDIRLHCPGVLLHEWVCPYLRVTVADMLNRAQALLPEGYRLKVGTALRTLKMQSSGWDGYFARMKAEHPDWPLSALRRATNKYFAPYDQKAPPGHCTGGAVDVGLVNPAGESLDMVAPTKGWEGAYTWSEKISPEARANRMMMVEAMLEAGFSNCRDEFWHYSWGDSAWAVRTGVFECPYAWAHPPVRVETDFDGACAADIEVDMERDGAGKPLQARVVAGAKIEPDHSGSPSLHIGLYWANGVPVTLNVLWPRTAPDPCLYSGDGKGAWTPLEGAERDGSLMVVRLTPQADRIRITSSPPPVESTVQPSA
jgi:D-alanyl-D-alanine dipeptidase